MTPIEPTDAVVTRGRAPLRTAIVIALAVLAAISLAACAGLGEDANACAEPCTKVLFIGNSHTLVNDLPSQFEQLARSGGRNVEVEMLAREGTTLEGHVATADTAPLIASRDWDFVVLQEGSEVVTIDLLRQQHMTPALNTLVPMIREAGAKPLLFSAWGFRNGIATDGLTSYERMQAAMTAGYDQAAGEWGLPVAPVGAAWQRAVNGSSALELWAEDGVHASPAGTYLAAGVFYASIFGESPAGLDYQAGLEPADAAALQNIAAAAAAQ